MNTPSHFLRHLGLAVAMLLLTLGILGCEESTDGLTVQPSFVQLMPGSNTVNFVVTGDATNETFAAPVDWSVSNPALGTIVGSSGFTALYVANDGAVGDNIITARDGLDNEGFATIKQTGQLGTLTLTAAPNPIPGDENTTLIAAVGGVAPFEWWSRDRSLGDIISAAGSDTAVYQSAGPGVNVVHATDVNGLTGTLTITQQSPGTEDAGLATDTTGGP